jgi:hypothetical protein
MNTPSLQRLEVARRIAPLYAAEPGVRAVLVHGSVARGWADRYSDVEVVVLWNEPPTETQRQSIAQSAAGTGWECAPFRDVKQSWSEHYFVDGLEIDASHMTVEAVESIIEDVMLRFDVSNDWLVFDKQATVAMIQHAIVLHGTPLIEQWRAQVLPYPRELAVAMVQKHLRFGPFGSRAMLAERGEIPLMYENNCPSTRNLINILFGLNRIYHPGFKWTRQLFQHAPLQPTDFFARLEQVFKSAPVEGTRELRSLIEETFDLIEAHLPEVEIEPHRTRLAEPYRTWPSAEAST